jgi:hypothetical protein
MPHAAKLTLVSEQAPYRSAEAGIRTLCMRFGRVASGVCAALNLARASVFCLHSVALAHPPVLPCVHVDWLHDSLASRASCRRQWRRLYLTVLPNNLGCVLPTGTSPTSSLTPRWVLSLPLTLFHFPPLEETLCAGGCFFLVPSSLVCPE